MEVYTRERLSAMLRRLNQMQSDSLKAMGSPPAEGSSRSAPSSGKAEGPSKTRPPSSPSSRSSWRMFRRGREAEPTSSRPDCTGAGSILPFPPLK